MVGKSCGVHDQERKEERILVQKPKKAKIAH
jgi:hypothetical protein